MKKRDIEEIKDVNDVTTGFVLRDLRYFIEPLDKKETINLHDKSQIFLTIDEKDSNVALSDMFLSIHSTSGDVIRGFSMLVIIDEKSNEVDINGSKTKVTFYDKVTGVHFKITEVDTCILMQDDKTVTTEQMIKYASILENGKVTAKNAVVEGEGETVEEKLRKAEEAKAALEEKERLVKEAEEKKIADEKEAEEEKDRLAIEAKKKADEEAESKRIKDEEEAQKIADAKEQGRIEAIKKQLGGQAYLDVKDAHEKEGFQEFDKGPYRFFFKGENEVLYFYKLVTGEVISLEDTMDEYEEDPQTGVHTYAFTEDGENKSLIFNPKEGYINVKKSTVKAE